MTLRVLAYLFFAAVPVLLGAAAYEYYLARDAVRATVEDLDPEFPSLLVGTNEFSMVIHNPTKHDIRVVGMSTC